LPNLSLVNDRYDTFDPTRSSAGPALWYRSHLVPSSFPIFSFRIPLIEDLWTQNDTRQGTWSTFFLVNQVTSALLYSSLFERNPLCSFAKGVPIKPNCDLCKFTFDTIRSMSGDFSLHLSFDPQVLCSPMSLETPSFQRCRLVCLVHARFARLSSILVEPHTGPTNMRVRCHLVLQPVSGFALTVAGTSK
jgi:hypothetical protein